MKGHMQDGKFHPHTQYKGVRKSRDQKAKIDGVKIRKDRDVAYVGFSSEEIEEHGGKLVSPFVKEFIKRKVEKIFGNAIISIEIMFNDERHPTQESPIRFESDIKVLTPEMVREVNAHSGLHISNVGTPFKNPTGKIRIDTEIARIFAEKEYADHQMILEVN